MKKRAVREVSDAALLALVDELPSLFADDAEDNSSSSSALRFASTQSLSVDELAELLSAIDDDGEQSSQPPQEQERPQKKTSVKAAPPKRKKVVASSSSASSNKVRGGRKEELVYLRKTVRELETRLDVLKSNKSTSTTVSPLSFVNQESNSYNNSSRRIASRLILADSDGGDRDVGLYDVWREIARHQCDERDRSERENIRLRVVLESQIKVAKSLEKFLLLKVAASSMEIGKSIDLQRGDQLSSCNDMSGRDRDAAIFCDLLMGVDQALAEVDAVYETDGLARVETTQINAQMRFDPATGLRVEVCASKMLPFEVHETGEAVWNHYMFAKERMPSRFYSYHSRKSTDATEDTIMDDYVLQIHSKNMRGSFRVRKVTRRVVEEDRIVIVWRLFSDPLEFSDQPLSGLRSFEKGYVVIRKSLSGASLRPSVTLLQPCHIVYPCAALEGDAVMGYTGDTVVGAITDFRLGATAEFVAGTHQMIENVLMEQATKRSGRAGIELSI